jgi:hypothetical protein
VSSSNIAARWYATKMYPSHEDMITKPPHVYDKNEAA